jgi:hypothetical protein
MLVNVQAETAGTGGLWSDDAPAGTGSALLTISGNFELDVNSTAPLTPVLSYDAWHLVIVYRRGTTWGISVDGVVTEHDYTTNQPTGIISFYIGAYFSNGTLQKGANMKVKVAFGMQRAPSSTELTYIRNAIHADFPSDTP